MRALYFAKPFLVPVAIAGLLSMLLVPMTRKLEKKGLNKGLATLIPIIALIALHRRIGYKQVVETTCQ